MVNLSLKDQLIGFWSKLGHMLESGVPLLPTLEAIEAEYKQNEIDKVVSRIIESIKKGECISDAIKSYPSMFPPSVVTLTEFGEKNGDMDRAAKNIATAISSGVILIPEGEEIVDETPVSDWDMDEISQWVEGLLFQAVEMRASDIHIQPFRESVKIKLRIDGALQERESIPRERYIRIITYIKMISGLDITEKRLPQDGRHSCETKGKKFEFRVAVIPTIFGESVTLRILDRSVKIPTIETLEPRGENKDKILRLTNKTHGLIIVTGPTGSGKTTTLYSILQHLNEPKIKIMTAEHPVEYVIEGCDQIQIQPSIGLNHASCLRSILRSDPDIVMASEIRDEETAKLLIEVAITGHLVFSVLHTSNAVGVFTRYRDIGIGPFLIRDALVGVVAQRLVRLLCPACKTKDNASSPELENKGLIKPGMSFMKAVGCSKCFNTGYLGRTALFEILEPCSRFQEAFTAGANHEQLQKIAVEEGMRTMLQDGIEKAAAGIVSISDVMGSAMV